MLKSILGFFVIANSALFAYNAGFLGAESNAGREPARLKNQLNAERMRIEPIAKVAVSAAAPDNSAKSAVAAVNNPSQSCVEIGDFDVADISRFNADIAPLSMRNVSLRNIAPQAERYIVFIPALPTRERQVQRMAQLRQKGVDDFYVLADQSELNQAISLGMFKSLEAAQQHLIKINQQGVRDAQIFSRKSFSKKTAFQMRGLDPQTLEALNKIKRAFPKQEMRACIVS